LRLIYLISLDLPEMPKQDLTRQELGPNGSQGNGQEDEGSEWFMGLLSRIMNR